jgi:hypothetical protein
MTMLLSRPRLAMRLSQAFRSAEVLSSYSAVGKWSTYSFRQRYIVMLKNQTDPTIADFFYEKWLHAWVGDPPSYNYSFLTAFALGVAFSIVSRHWFFNPDVYGRKQEMRKPMPDRHRQWSFSLPYYNHRLRAMCCKFKWAFIDNEPDYSDKHCLGYRAERKQVHRRPYLWVFCIPRYSIEDPLFTSVTHANMNAIYEEIGYTKKPPAEEED